MPDDRSRLIWAPQAWVDGRWRERVLLAIGADGRWAAVTPDTPAPPRAENVAAPVLPALVDAHSHAFQRAFAGLAEQRASTHDDFWSWRDRMYGVALRITPEQMRAIAAQLYVELLDGGYTEVCEFHYLHHDVDGGRYADPAAMAFALADAAADAGVGLTLLPTLYERAGFKAQGLRDDQRRFRTTVDEVLATQHAVRAAARPLLSCGAALHSLRAVRPQSLREVAARSDGPLHIHVAEQTAEVQDCLAETGLRPIAWLLAHAGMDARWQLVHATHSVPGEVDGVAACGAGVVLCPATEANLGDGVPDLPGWLAGGVPLALGSDSQVVRDWPEELRWLEYAQRLVRRERNVAADPGREPSTAARLFERVRAGGGAAMGARRWGLTAGARADLLVLDTADAALLGLPRANLLDGLVFAAPTRPFARTMVAGRWATPDRTAIARRYTQALHALWEQAAA
ncbi:MAG TPA: formimidoylglutamate deiminase [Rubrivivax sp.]|nr:formimidoylglutamate deiminase [Burkholderiales bacterium]HNT38456.1 formimidoylglutamate deiminase [Rubrivivax sp.]